MHWRIISVGKPSFSWAKVAVDFYLKRLQHYTKVAQICVRDGHQVQVESQLLIASEKTFRIILDERGKDLRSLDLAHWIGNQKLAGTKRVSVIIGGADGHSESFRQHADAIWNLSSFTLQHEVALIVLMEQIYRAHTILNGEPYHRE